jgi:DNA helicase-2/ATP-dependent DNA helicase PcrA
MINLDILNPPQKEAVLQTDGPVLVLAGAGSGKTRVLTYRTAFILGTGLAGPENLLILTFTNKAAGEMKTRILDILEADESTNRVRHIPWMGTFHSVCVKILKKYGNALGIDRNFVIYDPGDQTIAIKHAMERARISQKDFNPNAIHNYISFAKNELIDADEYEERSQGYFQNAVAAVYPHYQAILSENNALDFDDLLFKSVKLLQSSKQIRDELQETFRYILVDEYQDTNHAQYVFIKLLADKHRNICCVGDDDQSIYSFRGANIRNILSFEKDFNEAKIIKLEQNYRSTQTILEASYQVISKNVKRKDKKLWTENANGEKIGVYQGFDDEDESNWIVSRAEEFLTTGVSPKEIAVLYRTNSQSRGLEEAFLKAGIAYKIVGGIRFYDRKEIKDIIAYLRVLYNSKDTISFQRVVNVPKRGIGEKTISDYTEEARGRGYSPTEYMDIAENLNVKIKVFAQVIKDLRENLSKKGIVDFMTYLLERTKYLEELKDGSIEAESRIENIQELVNVASKYEGMETHAALESFLEEVGLLEGNGNTDEQSDAITMMTIHAAKGLEFEYVFVCGMEENLFPHSNSLMDPAEMEEERRLAYVAVTRAKHKLFLTHAQKRKYFGQLQRNPKSRFIEDINKELIEDLSPSYLTDSDAWDNKLGQPDYAPKKVNYAVGDEVKHEFFGKGVVDYMDSEIVIIDFGGTHGKKELMIEYAKLLKL